MALAAAGPAISKTPTRASRVVQVEHAGATTGKTSLDVDVVRRMIDQALMIYSGKKTPEAALATYFDAKQKIGIKVNTLGSPFSSVNPEVAHHLADLLERMGAKKTQIRIFDQYQTRMRKGRYRLRKPENGVWVTKHLGRAPAVQRYEHTYPDGTQKSVDFHWDQTMAWADAVLNVCIPKDHDLTGVTGALKNMAMGSIEPTVARQGDKSNPGHYTAVPLFHKDNCDPAIAWLYSRPMIRGKVKLILADALRVLYNGGPQDKPQWRARHNQIWVAQDPVAVDETIRQLINGIRKSKGMVPVEEAKFRGRPRPPRFIKTCAEYGLGTNDPKHITIDKKVLS